MMLVLNLPSAPIVLLRWLYSMMAIPAHYIGKHCLYTYVIFACGLIPIVIVSFICF